MKHVEDPYEQIGHMQQGRGRTARRRRPQADCGGELISYRWSKGLRFCASQSR